jgi:hypothetical protein
MIDVPKDKKVVLYRNIRIEVHAILQDHQYGLVISGEESKTGTQEEIYHWKVAAEDLIGGEVVLGNSNIVIGVVK